MIIHDLRRFVNSFLRIFSVPFYTRMLFSEAPAGFSTVESSANACKPQKCGIFLSNFVYFYVACVVCLWYNGLEVMMLETIF